MSQMNNQKNDLPSILNVATIPSIENMNIKTEVLDPITINQNQAVFQIPKTGILDGGSMLQVGVTTAGALFFPLNSGCHSIIKSCFLKVGGKVIASNEDYAHYTTMVRQFDTPEHRAYVDMVKSGCVADRFAEVESGRIGYRDLVATIDAGDATNSTFNVPDLVKPTNDDSTTPLFSIPLSVLIPMMKSRQLPLLAIKEHIYLEVNFNSQPAGTKGVICCETDGNAGGTAVRISEPNVKFVSDHLYYTSEKMDALSMQTMSQQGLSVLYEDLLLTNAQVPSSGVGGGGVVQDQKVERQIAVAGKTVRNILVSDKNAGENHELLGQYFSKDLQIPSAYNFRINEQRIYDRDVEDPPRKYVELSEVFNKPLMMPNQLYSFDCDTDKSTVAQALNQNSFCIGKVEGHQLPTATNTTAGNDVRATSSYVGYDATTTGFNVLGNGANIGTKPIILSRTYHRKQGNDQPRELRIFSGIEKIMVIKNGEVTISA